MVGGYLFYTDGTSSKITAEGSTTSITVANSKTVTAGASYAITYRGLSVSSTAAVTLQNTSDSTTAFSVQNAAGTSILTVDTTNSRLTVKDVVINGTLTLNGHLITGTRPSQVRRRQPGKGRR